MKYLDFVGPVSLVVVGFGALFFQLKIVPWLERRGINI